MHILFLIPLLAGIAASYIDRHSSDEIGYLMKSLSFFCFVLSLILAPWQIKAIVLLVVFGSVYQFWLFKESELETEQGRSLTSSKDSQPNVASKYRGVTYEPANSSTPAKSAESEELTVKYRGKSCQVVRSHLQTTSDKSFELKYRGASVHNRDKTSSDR
jgi:hypothetical protein